MIDVFVQQNRGEEEDIAAASAPEANAYEFQSSGVIDMLSKLLDKFIEERTALEKTEANSKNAYQLLMQDLKAQLSQAVKDRGSKALSKSKRLAAKAVKDRGSK